MTEISIYAPCVLLLGFLITLFSLLGRTSGVARAIASGACMLVSLRYLYWRVTTTMPMHQGIAQSVYAWIFLLVEIGAVGSSLLVYFFMSRTVDRSAEATMHQDSPLQRAPADVFIASYNESRDILERTIVGALAIQHPDLTIWLLDDSARPWAEELARALGVEYISRKSGKHAKAGNINNALQHALERDRKPEFLLLLDADFIPHRNLLRRTLGLFDDSSVGIVQTPQHFFNPDPVQSNLLCGNVWPDEQRFFFNSFLPSKDAWGAAFCCGTSAVFRVDALIAAGGMATETVTEDMLTTFKFDEVGYRTIFLNERLSLGLAPESLAEFISQRARWCLGAIQQIHTRWSFFGSARISFIHRLSYFDGFLYWASGAAFRILLVTAPILYWSTGVTPFEATGAELIYWAAPLFLANFLYMRFIAGNRILPVMSDITQLLIAFVVFRTVVTGFIRPFGRPFKVTAKGLSKSGVTVQWRILWKFAALSGLTLLGVFAHLSRYSAARDAEAYSFSIGASLLSASILALTAAACIEVPHRRRDERFETGESAYIRLEPALDRQPGPCSTAIPCVVRDISLGGASLVLSAGAGTEWVGAADSAQLVLSDGAAGTIALPFSILLSGEQVLTIEFCAQSWVRHALIRKLFTGTLDKEIEEINAGKVLFRLARLLTS